MTFQTSHGFILWAVPRFHRPLAFTHNPQGNIKPGAVATADHGRDNSALNEQLIAKSPMISESEIPGCVCH